MLSHGPMKPAAFNLIELHHRALLTCREVCAIHPLLDTRYHRCLKSVTVSQIVKGKYANSIQTYLFPDGKICKIGSYTNTLHTVMCFSSSASGCSLESSFHCSICFISLTVKAKERESMSSSCYHTNRLSNTYYTFLNA